MTEDQILEMTPGRELNILVAKHVLERDVVADELMGDTERIIDETGDTIWGDLRSYSQDMAAASAVVEKMKERGHTDAGTWENYGSGCYQPAEAVCKKALLEVLAKQ